MNYILLVKNFDKLLPAYSKDLETFKRISNGEIIIADLDDKRNLKFHRKYFNMLNFVYENMSEEMHERIPSVDILRAEVMRIMGKVEIYFTIDNKRILIPQSISFAKMGQKKFEKIYSATIDVCLKYFLPDTGKEDFELELLNYE